MEAPAARVDVLLWDACEMFWQGWIRPRNTESSCEILQAVSYVLDITRSGTLSYKLIRIYDVTASGSDVYGSDWSGSQVYVWIIAEDPLERPNPCPHTTAARWVLNISSNVFSTQYAAQDELPLVQGPPFALNWHEACCYDLARSMIQSIGNMPPRDLQHYWKDYNDTVDARHIAQTDYLHTRRSEAEDWDALVSEIPLDHYPSPDSWSSSRSR